MPLRPDMEPGEILDILRRRKWIVLYVLLLSLFGATVYCVLAPDVYQSTAKIRLIPPVVPEGMVRSTLNIKTRDRLPIIQQEILSHERLKRMSGELGLPGGGGGPTGDKAVESIRKRITLDVNRNNTFILSFEHEDPRLAREVATRLTSFFIEENAKSRESDAQGTASFLESQLEATRQKLEQQEARLKQYKVQYGGELPEQMQANLGRLARLQDLIRTNSESITRMEDRKIYMESQVSSLEGQILAARNAYDNLAAAPLASRAAPHDPAQPLLHELSLRRKKLEDLMAKYTALHPSVVQARANVEQLEARIAELRLAVSQEEEQAEEGQADPARVRPPAVRSGMDWEVKEVRRLRERIAATDLEITAKKKETANAAQVIETIQAKVERLPQREQELIALTRDYGNLKNTYDDLLKKKLQADIYGNLQEKQQAEQFLVVEPANLPTKPIKPDRLKVLALALMGSLVIGAGGSVGRELLDPRLRGSREFRSFFDLPVLACLPVIQDDSYRRRIVVRRAAVVGGLVSILGAYLFFLVMHGDRVKTIIQTLGGPE